MADSGPPLFSAVVASPRQLFHVLNTVSFASRIQVRISHERIKFAAVETGVLNAFVYLEKKLFTSYRLSTPTDDPTSSPPNISFSLQLPTLLSTLQILSSAAAPDTSNPRLAGPYGSDALSSALATHRLARHAGAFSAAVLGTQGQCRLVYRRPGARLELSVPETAGMRTACGLATFLGSDAEAGWGAGAGSDEDADPDADADADDIPFDREQVCLKAILPASVLGDAIAEICALGPPEVLVVDAARSAPYLVLRGEGSSGGECRVEFGEETLAGGRTKLLETFLCSGRVRARYGLLTVRKALGAMRAGTKVSLRIDRGGVLSMQFLVQLGDTVEEMAAEEMAFVDFKIVPLFGEDEGSDGTGSDE